MSKVYIVCKECLYHIMFRVYVAAVFDIPSESDVVIIKDYPSSQHSRCYIAEGLVEEERQKNTEK